MIITRGALDALFTGYKTAFNKGFQDTVSYLPDIAMRVPSQARQETYGWINPLTPIREWIGPRVATTLSASGYTIVNKKFERTIGVQRDDIEDDQIGLFGPMFEMMGRDAKVFPDEQTFALLAAGFTTDCFDGQPFFDTDHPVGTPGLNEPVSVSNVQAGAGSAWFLIDGSKPIKPLIYQERMPFDLASLDKSTDENVFLRDEYLYGTRGRSNVGFGLWQLAYGSKADLTAENYEAARVAMRSLKNDSGKALGIVPTHLIVPPALEGDGLRLLKAVNPDGGTNEWANTTKLICTPLIV